MCFRIETMLPSDVCFEFTLFVSQDCLMFFSVMWPVPIGDFGQLHCKWLQSSNADHIELYHPKLIGFEEFLKEIRSCSIDITEPRAKMLYHVRYRPIEQMDFIWDGTTVPLE